MITLRVYPHRALKTPADVGETQCDRKLWIMLRQICLFPSEDLVFAFKI